MESLALRGGNKPGAAAVGSREANMKRIIALALLLGPTVALPASAQTSNGAGSADTSLGSSSPTPASPRIARSRHSRAPSGWR